MSFVHAINAKFTDLMFKLKSIKTLALTITSLSFVYRSSEAFQFYRPTGGENQVEKKIMDKWAGRHKYCV